MFGLLKTLTNFEFELPDLCAPQLKWSLLLLYSTASLVSLIMLEAMTTIALNLHLEFSKFSNLVIGLV